MRGGDPRHNLKEGSYCVPETRQLGMMVRGKPMPLGSELASLHCSVILGWALQTPFTLSLLT